MPHSRQDLDAAMLKYRLSTLFAVLTLFAFAAILVRGRFEIGALRRQVALYRAAADDKDKYADLVLAEMEHMELVIPRIVFERFGIRNEYSRFVPYAEFSIRNNSSRVLWYTGYESGTPLYLEQRKNDAAWESAGSTSICGTGLDSRAILPRETVTFKVNLFDDPRSVRVGVAFRSRERGGEWARIWSDEVTVPVRWDSRITVTATQ